MKINIKNTDIDINIGKIIFCDNLNKIDSLKIILNGKDPLEWDFEYKDKIDVSIGSFETGSMYLENLHYKNNVFTLNAYSCKDTLTKRSRTWENTTLITFLKDIAKQENLKLEMLGVNDVKYDRIDQVNINNMAFLFNRAILEDLNIKVCKDTLYVISESYFKSKKIDYSFNKNDNLNPEFCFYPSNYGICNIISVKNNGNVIKCKYTEDKNKEILTHEINLGSAEEGNRFAKNILKHVNRYNYTIKFTTEKEFEICAGMKIKIDDYGLFNGIYIIDSVEYSTNKNKAVGRRI